MSETFERAVEIGDNSKNFAADQLKSIVERIERLEEERKSLGDDIRDIYAESKGNGYCPKTLRKIVAIRKKDPGARAEEAALMETYLHALGME